MYRSNSERKGFTLVELLVVIGIIALLISILLPSLARARQAANTVKCAANLRGIIQGMQIYASQNNGYIPGSPNTTGRFLWKPAIIAGMTTTTAKANDPQTGVPWNENDCPDIVASADWMSPVLLAEGITAQASDPSFVLGKTPHFNRGSDRNSRLSRFEFYRTFPSFVCPENFFQAIPYSGSTLQCSVGPNVSYFMAFEFLIAPRPTGVTILGGTLFDSGPTSSFALPQGYSPKFSAIKNSSRKICIADGNRYNDPSTPSGVPDIDINVYDSGGDSFADSGSFTQSSHSWVRDYPGTPNGETAPFIAKTNYMLITYRHSGSSAQTTLGNYYMNCGFYDGHVETLDDLSSSNPSFWAPTGSVLNNGQGFFGTPWADTAARFQVPATGNYVIP